MLFSKRTDAPIISRNYSYLIYVTLEVEESWLIGLELKAYFESQNIPFPILLHRNAAVLIPSKTAKKLDSLNLKSEDLFLKAFFFNK